MAKKQKKELDYGALRKRLLEQGPGRLYMLRGQEDYLRDSFLQELKGLCLAEGTEDFNYHQLKGPVIDLGELARSMEAMPFMGERTLTEVRDFDVNRVSAYDPDALRAMLEDIPDWATVVFVFSPDYEPNGTYKAVKAMRKAGEDIEFTAPPEDELCVWAVRRMKGLGKKMDRETARHLVRTCGDRMSALIPEIVKVANYAQGEAVTRADIDAVAKKAPETTVFELANALGSRRFDEAATLLADLLAGWDEKGTGPLGWVSDQYRQLYVAKVAETSGQGRDYILNCVPEAKPWAVDKYLRPACRGYSVERLARAVSLCAECEYKMKSGGGRPKDLMKELVLSLAMDRS